LTFDEVVACDSVSTKADFIFKRASNGPMLVYCKEALSEALRVIGLDPLFITEDTDPDLLRNLDKVLETGMYRVLVA
jgi:hypothetical protein